MLGVSVVLGQEEICHPVEDDQKLWQAYEENPILKQQIEVLKSRIEIQKQELEIKDKLIALEEKRAEVYKQAYEAEKELTDRALKLSEKKSSWEILGTLGLIAIIITVIASVL